jgi:cytochrome c biogenesis protein CcmG/thiol:disulfide interchange protein DsbE
VRRPALWISVAIAVVLAGLIGILFTREPATDRLVKSPLVGHIAPDAFDIDADRGRFVLVNFFATWCVPCQDEHDDLVRFSRAHRDDARVVSIVFSDDFDEAQRFFERRGGDWPLLDDAHGAIATAWGVARVPESYLVAPNGRVVGKVTGGVTFDFLEKQLARYS